MLRKRLTKHEHKTRKALQRLRMAHEALLRARDRGVDPWALQDLEGRMARAQQDLDDLVNEPDPDVLRARELASGLGGGG